ncbi:hypothetical protein P692DRAFT_20827866 [Suillus brevipes Sb2]|nr:hypothetical protein P692DRAFT_20827866 [Suillus brevipes Sb2]
MLHTNFAPLLARAVFSFGGHRLSGVNWLWLFGLSSVTGQPSATATDSERLSRACGRVTYESPSNHLPLPCGSLWLA